MTNPTEVIQELLKFTGALYILTGLMTWRRGGPKEDEIVVIAADTVLDTLSDSDKVAKIDMRSGRNVRDQITIEQAEELYNDRQIRSWGERRN